MKSGAAFFLSCGIVFLPSVARAQCVEFKDPAELFKLSDAVFVGTAVATEPTGAQGSDEMVSIATLSLERTWKGQSGRQVRVATDIPFEVGKKYVVFAAGHPLTASIRCRWAELVGEAERKLNWLGRRRSRPAD